MGYDSQHCAQWTAGLLVNAAYSNDHNIQAALGIDFAVSSFRLRPELAMLFCPAPTSRSGGASRDFPQRIDCDAHARTLTF